ncbi:MAG: DUF4372 domain-containing protein [Magnetospirillum sp. WYHS-4]
MLFCHLARADSLREICGRLSCCLGKLTHLGLDEAPKRSTLSNANEHRPAALYEDLFWGLLSRLRGQGRLGRGHGFRFKNKLLSLDSTTVSLCLNLLPPAPRGGLGRCDQGLPPRSAGRSIPPRGIAA